MNIADDLYEALLQAGVKAEDIEVLMRSGKKAVYASRLKPFFDTYAREERASAKSSGGNT